MPKRKPFSVVRFIREAAVFLRKQPALWPATILLIAVPSFLMTLTSRLQDSAGPLGQTSLTTFLQENDPQGLSLLLAVGVFSVFTVWGLASVLLVGRRMIGNRAGRARTSLSSVLKDSAEFVFPISFTSIIQLAHILLWLLPALVIGFAALFYHLLAVPPGQDSVTQQLLWMLPALLLALPSIAYIVRSSFFSIVVVTEDLTCSPALKRSREVVTGYFWSTFRVLLLAMVILLGPAVVLTLALEPFVHQSMLTLVIVDATVNLVSAFLTALFILVMILLYGTLRDAPRSVKI